MLCTKCTTPCRAARMSSIRQYNGSNILVKSITYSLISDRRDLFTWSIVSTCSKKSTIRSLRCPNGWTRPVQFFTKLERATPFFNSYYSYSYSGFQTLCLCKTPPPNLRTKLGRKEKGKSTLSDAQIVSVPPTKDRT